MRIVAWNIKNNNKDKIKNIIEEVNNLNTDILVVTEYSNNATGTILRRELNKNGFSYFFWRKKLSDKFKSVLICSKIPYEKVNYINDNKFMSIKINDINICGMFISYGLNKNQLQDNIFKINKIFNENEKVVFIGNLLTAQNYVENSSSIYTNSNKYIKFDEIGLVDIWSLTNVDKKEYSWYSKNGTGYRVDQALCSKNLINSIDKCFYNHNTRIKNISENSMIILDVNS